MGSALTLPAMALAMGDRFVVETEGEPNFEAVVLEHRGWGLVHGVIEIGCQRADDAESMFLYGIGYQTPVEVKRHTHRNGVVETDGSGPNDATCGGCGRSWDDSVSTALTPTPSARCPFEYEHEEGTDD